MSRCWLKVIKKVKTDQKLVLFYLINDVVQHSKRKNLTDLIARCQTAIREAVPALRKEAKIAPKIRRVLTIWGEREVLEEAVIQEMLTEMDDGDGGPAANKDDKDAAGKAEEIVDNFQVSRTL